MKCHHPLSHDPPPPGPSSLWRGPAGPRHPHESSPGNGCSPGHALQGKPSFLGFSFGAPDWSTHPILVSAPTLPLYGVPCTSNGRSPAPTPSMAPYCLKVKSPSRPSMGAATELLPPLRVLGPCAWSDGAGSWSSAGLRPSGGRSHFAHRCPHQTHAMEARVSALQSGRKWSPQTPCCRAAEAGPPRAGPRGSPSPPVTQAPE